jgi:hypothetical protein
MRANTAVTELSQVIDESLGGDGLSLAEAARLVPAFRPGKPTNASTVWRWSAKGVRLPDGRRTRLETCRIGGRKMTSRAALGRFIQAQTRLADMEPSPVSAPPTLTRRHRMTQRASEELDRIGI